MQRETSIVEQIERSREEMSRVASIHSLTSPEVLQASRELDELLNEFERNKV